MPTKSYQLLAAQTERMTDFFGAPQVPNHKIPQIQNVVPMQIAPVPNNVILHVPQVEPHAQPQVEPNPWVIIVNINQNADEIVRNVQNNKQ
jgi:hypothetical protein